jgi:hypothetical protein
MPVVSFHCFPYIRKWGWKAERVLRVTRLLLIHSREDVQKGVIRSLIQEMDEIGKRAGVQVIEIEVYRKIDSKIFFPSTNCAVNTWNQPEWVELFEGAGFAHSKRMYCFELDLGSVNEGVDGEVFVRRFNSHDDRDKRLYYQLWNLSGECPYALTDSGFWYSNVFGWPRLWYSEIAHILNRDDYILFAEKEGGVMGFIHWWPNLYPLLKEAGRKAVLVGGSLVDDTLGKIEEGKIFKIIVNKKAGKDTNLVKRVLINESMKLMKEKFKFKRCQIGNIPREKENISSYIYKNSGKKVHEIWLMRKKISRFF